MKLRVLLVTHQEFQMPEDIAKLSQKEIADWKTEYEIVTALKTLGHETQILGAPTELKDLRDCLTSWNPNVVFNQLEEFWASISTSPTCLGFSS